MAWSDLTSDLLAKATTVFGQSVTYTPNGGTGISIQGILDDSYQEVALGPALPVSSTHPLLGIRLADLGAVSPGKGDTVTIAAATYKVLDSRPDGQGGAQLRLQKQ